MNKPTTENKLYVDKDGNRRAPRTKIKRFVDYVINGKLCRGISDNLSATGIFLKSKYIDHCHLNDRLVLAFQMPDNTPFKYNGQVVRITDEGIGIQYL